MVRNFRTVGIAVPFVNANVFSVFSGSVTSIVRGAPFLFGMLPALHNFHKSPFADRCQVSSNIFSL